MEHTPGPWTIGVTFRIERRDPPGREGQVIHVAYVCHDAVPKDEEADANALLIAAAPEMYEALNAIRGLLHLHDCDWATAILRDQINAALIKAEGTVKV